MKSGMLNHLSIRSSVASRGQSQVYGLRPKQLSISSEFKVPFDLYEVERKIIPPPLSKPKNRRIHVQLFHNVLRLYKPPHFPGQTKMYILAVYCKKHIVSSKQEIIMGPRHTFCVMSPQTWLLTDLAKCELPKNCNANIVIQALFGTGDMVVRWIFWTPNGWFFLQFLISRYCQSIHLFQTNLEIFYFI